MDNNRVHIKVNAKFINALIDTGCRISVLRESLLHRLKIIPEPLGRQDTKILFGANGSQMPVVGKVLLPVKLQGLIVPFEFLVTESLTHDLLLGHDFLTETKALIKYADSSITFYDNMVELKLLSKTSNIVALVEKEYDLEPESESLIPVCLTQNISGTDMLLEALPMRENQKFLIAKPLAPIIHGKTFCQVMNPTTQVIHLKYHLPIASVSQIDTTSISSSPLPRHHDRSYVNVVDTTYHDPIRNTNFHQNLQPTFSNAQYASQQSTPNLPYTQGQYRTLKELGISINNTNLSETEKATLSKLLEDNSDVFALSLHDLPGTTLQTYDIDTGDSKPVRQRPYRPSPAGRIEMSKQIKELLDAGFIEPCTGPWASPCILVKKNGGPKICNRLSSVE